MSKLMRIPSNIKTIGSAIRFLRERKGMSLRALGATIGVSAPFLSDLERDRRKTDKLAEIAKALDADEETLRALDGRLTQDLKDWIAANPGMIAILREMRKGGIDPSEYWRGRGPRRAGVRKGVCHG